MEKKNVITRLILKGKWNGNINDAKRVLKLFIYNSNEKSDIVCACGAFLTFSWPNKTVSVEDTSSEANNQILIELIKAAELQCSKLLNSEINHNLSNITEYLTFGIDSYDPDSNKHVELVCIYNCEKHDFKWTGKFYPLGWQEKSLIRFTDLDSHFININQKSALILGCHDLNVFNPRALASAKGWRLKLAKQFSKMVKQYKPEIIIQHPHTTDSEKIWILAWHKLKRDIPSVKHYASAILYHNPNGRCRSSLSRVLEKTKYGNVQDIIIK